MRDRKVTYSKRKQQVHRQLLVIGIVIGLIIIAIVSCRIEKSAKRQEAKVNAKTEQTSKKEVQKAASEKVETGEARLVRVKAEAQKKGYPADVMKLLDKNAETIDFVEDYETKKDEPYASVVGDDLVKGKIPQLLQWDGRWGYAPYGTGIVATCGCGPTCMSMVVAGLTGDASVTPAVVADYGTKNNYLDEENNTYWEFMKEAGKNWGISCYEGTPEEKVVQAELSAGHPIICSVGPGYFTQNGHFIVLTAYENGQVKVNDPFSQANSDRMWTFADIQGQIKAMWVYSYNP